MKEIKANIIAEIESLRTDVLAYFDKCTSIIDVFDFPWDDDSNFFWDQISSDLKDEAGSLIKRLVSIGQRTALMCKNSLLVDNADLGEIPILIKRMRAAIFLRRFYHSPADVVHDEGTIIGFKSASQEEGSGIEPQTALKIYDSSNNELGRIVQLADELETFVASESTNTMTSVNKYRPNTAFIMMWMDATLPELEDVKEAVCDTFGKFGIRAIRADDIEHEGKITQRIIDEIKTSEFLFADLTGARPNVYYEVGFAHAMGKRVIMYRKKGTGIHFDLGGYNCPEYDNITDLKKKLIKRLESNTGKQISK